MLAVTALLAAFGILGLYSQIVAPVSPYASQLVVLIGLAVAVDYSLFMVTRFRTERRHGRTKLAAIEASSATAGRAVFFSGLAVMISIGGLFLLDDPLFRSMAVGTISVVLVAVIGSLTFLPATLAILGDGINRLRIPILGRERPEGSGLWASVVRAVMRRPVISAVVERRPAHRARPAGVPAPPGAGRLHVVPRLARRRPGGEPAEREVADRLRPGPVGRRHPRPTRRRRRPRSTGMTARHPGDPRHQRAGRRRQLSADGKIAFISYMMSGGPNDPRNQDIVRQVRSDRRAGGLRRPDRGAQPWSRATPRTPSTSSDFYADGMPR